MAGWATAEVLALGVLIAFLALLATLARRSLTGHQRDFRLLLERIDTEAEGRERETREVTARIDREAEERQKRFDKEAEKAERAVQAAIERSDRAFETLTVRVNVLSKKLAGITQCTARGEGTLAITAGGPRAGSKSRSAADETARWPLSKFLASRPRNELACVRQPPNGNATGGSGRQPYAAKGRPVAPTPV